MNDFDGKNRDSSSTARSSVLWGLASACPHLHGGLGGQLRGWQRAHHQVRQGQQASGRCPQREDLLHHRWNG